MSQARSHELSADGAAAEQAAAEACALFLGQSYKLNGALRLEALLVKHSCGFQCGDNAGRAVKAAAGLDSVKMAAGHDDGGIGILAFKSADDDADRVFSYFKACGLHFGNYIICSLSELLGIGEAGAANALNTGKLCKALNIFLYTFHFCQHHFIFLLVYLNGRF